MKLGAADVDGIEGHDMYVYQHSNHNCIIGAAETHPIVREGKTVTHINFQPGKIDHLKLQIKGKGKKVRVCSLGRGSAPALQHDPLATHGGVVLLMAARGVCGEHRAGIGCSRMQGCAK